MKTIDEHIDELKIAIGYLEDDFAIVGYTFENCRYYLYFYILILYYLTIQRVLLI